MTELVNKPDHGEEIIRGQRASARLQAFFDEVERDLNDNLLGPQVQLRAYTVATLPVATVAGGLIYVSDETGGAVVAFSDGVAWRRVTDRAIVS